MVRWLGAVQAQDYAGAKWALGQRIVGATEAAIERAFETGAILRTHVLRPTWHFVTPADIRWMLALTAPRIHALSAFIYRKLELDAPTLRRSATVLTKSLRGSRHLTRAELGAALTRAGISTSDGIRLGYLMFHAELEGLICSGPRRGKQFTYALLEERVAPAKAFTREESLAELARRYFTSHGPATVHDFACWSGLTLKDCRQGVALLGTVLERDEIAGATYHFSPRTLPAKKSRPRVHLLPNYDEYFIGFKDRSAIGQRIRRAEASTSSRAFLAHILTVDGQVIGGWKRDVTKSEVVIALELVTPLTTAEGRAVKAEVERYRAFLGLPAARWTEKAA
jgi:hypothetical protein